MADAVEWWWRWQAVAMAVEAVVSSGGGGGGGGQVAVKWQSSGGQVAVGVVHASVDQKLVKSNKITGFNQCPKNRVQTLF